MSTSTNAGHAGNPTMNQEMPMATVFLDIDDVLCLNDPYGGFDAIDAINERHPNVDAVYGELFARDAVAVLRQVHDTLGGRLRYVVSSTWRQAFSREQLHEVFSRSGLGFVADKLHEPDRWCTPSGSNGCRADDIAAWLEDHHAGEPFVIVDDSYSGASLTPALSVASHPFFGRVVRCEESVGLTPGHVQAIVAALQRAVDGKAASAISGETS